MKKEGRIPIIGITGGLGTGKTTVAKMLAKFGCLVLDADKIAHGTFRRGSGPYNQIVKLFGRSILDKSEGISRKKMAKVVFKNRGSLKKLCDIIHPIVVEKIQQSIEKSMRASSVPGIVIDAPLLIEAGLHKIADYLIVVTAGRPLQLSRLLKTGFTREEIVSRIKNQMPLGKKIRLADYVVDNGGSKAETEKIVRKIWKKINPV